MVDKYEDILNNIPLELKKRLSPEILSKVCSSLEDSAHCKALRENLATFGAIMDSNRFTVQAFFNACKFITFKSFGLTDKESYRRLFPDKYYEVTGKGKDISPYVNAYKNSVLVTKIRERCSIQSWILNFDRRNEAIDTLYNIMIDENVASRNRIEAAKELLDKTAPPKDSNLVVNVGINNNNNILNKIDDQLTLIARNQIEQLSKGKSLNDVINIPISLDS